MGWRRGRKNLRGLLFGIRTSQHGRAFWENIYHLFRTCLTQAPFPPHTHTPPDSDSIQEQGHLWACSPQGPCLHTTPSLSLSARLQLPLPAAGNHAALALLTCCLSPSPLPTAYACYGTWPHSNHELSLSYLLPTLRGLPSFSTLCCRKGKACHGVNRRGVTFGTDRQKERTQVAWEMGGGWEHSCLSHACVRGKQQAWQLGQLDGGAFNKHGKT